MASNRIKNTSAIASNKLFNGLDENNTGINFNQKDLIEFNEGSVIFKTGEEAGSVFLIVEGEVKIKSPGNRMFGANIISKYKDDFFGEIEFLENVPRKSSAVANSRCLIYILKKTEIAKEKQIIQNLTAAVRTKARDSKEESAGREVNFPEKPVVGGSNQTVVEILPQIPLDNNVEYPAEPETVHFEPEIADIKAQREPEAENVTTENVPDGEDIQPEIEPNVEASEYVNEPGIENPGTAGEIAPEKSNNGDEVPDNKEDTYEYVDEPDIYVETTDEGYEEVTVKPDEPAAIPPNDAGGNGTEEPPKQAAVKAGKLDRMLGFLTHTNLSYSKELAIENGISFIKHVTGAEFCIIYDVDYNKNEAAAIYNGNEIILPIGSGLAGKAALNGEIIRIEDALNNPAFDINTDRIGNINFESLLFVPVKDEAGIIRMIVEAANINGGITEENVLITAATGRIICQSVKRIDFFREQVSSERMAVLEKSARFILNDLKTPALLIKHYTDFIKSDAAAGNTENILNLISLQSENILNYLKAVLTFSGNEQPQEKEKEDINILSGYILSLLAEYVESRKSRLFKKINAEGFISVNRNEIYQALYQLVKNSCDAMPEGGKIYIAVTAEEDNLIIEIKDTGIGIPDAMLANIFEPFDNSHNKDKAGLGLALTNKLIGNNSGIMQIESELGEGTTIRIHIPLVKE